jgi:branched-subunit amino acid ABC-type transport system permease component
VLDGSVIVAQALSGLTTAMFLFLTAVGLSLIFGVLRVLNFAHGSFYMLGAYGAYQFTQWLGGSADGFWLAVLASALTIALVGGVVERLLLRHLYDREQLFQLLFTYALVLIVADLVKAIWGVQQVPVSRPPGLDGSLSALGTIIPAYNLFIVLLGPCIALALWFGLQKTRVGRVIRAAALDREMVGMLGVNVSWLYTGVFVLGIFLAGLGGALVTPVSAVVLGMDADMVIAAFIAVVIGGLGSFWGTMVGALIYGQVLSFGILFLPRFSLFAVFLLMAVVLIFRPHGLLGRAALAR